MLERRRNRFELGRRADVLCEHHRVRKGIRPATKGGPLIRAFISRASVNPDDCRIQGNLLIDRSGLQTASACPSSKKNTNDIFLSFAR